MANYNYTIPSNFYPNITYNLQPVQPVDTDGPLKVVAKWYGSKRNMSNGLQPLLFLERSDRKITAIFESEQQYLTDDDMIDKAQWYWRDEVGTNKRTREGQVFSPYFVAFANGQLGKPDWYIAGYIGGEEPKNNDNRETCYWCGASTKKILLFNDYANVCSKCGR